MSRKESRASVAARRKAIAQRRERAQRAVEATPDAADPSAPPMVATRRSRARVSLSAPPTSKSTASDARLWNALLVGGAAIACGLLGRELVDMYQDRARPQFLQNDIYSALGSIALLVIVGVFAYNRWRQKNSA